MLRILIAHDLNVLAEGLRALLEAAEDVEVVGAGTDPTDLLPLLETNIPDILIVGAGAPGHPFDGEEVIRHARAAVPALKTIALLRRDNGARLEAILDLGVQGLMSEDGAATHLLQAVRMVHGGCLCVCGEFADRVQMALARQGRVCARDTDGQGHRWSVTQRELEVLQMRTGGAHRKEIAHRMALAPSTVETYFRRLRRKFGLHSNAELAHVDMRRIRVRRKRG